MRLYKRISYILVTANSLTARARSRKVYSIKKFSLRPCAIVVIKAKNQMQSYPSYLTITSLSDFRSNLGT
jgi:hypothetical protein